MDQLLKLSLSTQIALGSGYIAYCIAYMGIRSHHKAIDATFSTLGFSLVATLILSPAPKGWPSADQPWVSIAAVGITLLFGLNWRWWLRDALTRAARKLNVSWSDDCPSTLHTISNSKNFYTTQIAVQLDDGTFLRCDDASLFNDAPFGPCIIGEDGSVSLYLTHKDDESGISKSMNSVKNDDYGHRLTYVPSNRIKQINFRHKRR